MIPDLSKGRAVRALPELGIRGLIKDARARLQLRSCCRRQGDRDAGEGIIELGGEHVAVRWAANLCAL